ncbi:11-beta-hydroxysteroid dehydrogenase-like 6 [Hibiscus syriacus]|uniref:11-beta-hydroxysteroid dehydrogenase-like 6 n=1 Tax=Hibiscus syriacus TaxID=106335 RepID=A0A6A2ZSY9_HIBSY|nr:11-beta-hydroxysteroid dehydrogenase-like 6 [Hibiscus syriacus]KAE8694537.1 11-beta-hydroxysteroid dehydrogenase-like 6 [Hibiscus syriacus]
MDLADKLMNVIVVTVSLLAPFFLHQYRSLKAFISTARTLFKENVTGEVVLITGASSGIGEHLAYEYARRGARLALVARRKHRLQEVNEICDIIGSPETVYILGDVSNIEDCKRFVDATVDHFGQLDHLVTNAGVAPVCLFEDYEDITKALPAMDINFWGSAYSTYFALQHLRKSKGKIIVISSCSSWVFAPRTGFYSASKAALISFYEAMRIELGTQIGITIVTPGFIDTEMTEGKCLSKEGTLEVDREMRDVQVNVMPVETAERCAKAIVESACRGDKYLTVPSWMHTTVLWRVFFPEMMDWWNGVMLMAGAGSSSRDAPSKKLLHVATGIKQLFSLEAFLTPSK